VVAIVLLQEGPVEHDARIPDAKKATRLDIVAPIPIPREMVGIDAHLLGLRRGDDLERLAILQRVAARERPRGSNARTDEHRVPILAALHELHARDPLSVGTLHRVHVVKRVIEEAALVDPLIEEPTEVVAISPLG
jgi:hypothetical protein